MVAKINYSKAKVKLLSELVAVINATEKGTLKEIVARDVIHQDIMNKPLHELWYNDIFSWGVYLFFDPNDRIRYVGKSKNGFYGRLMSQMDTTHRPFWGWNALLRKMGGEITGKAHDKLSDADHEIDYKTLLKYKLFLIEIEKGELSEKQLGWLEKYVMKAFREEKNQKLLNTQVGWLTEQEKAITINELVKE